MSYFFASKFHAHLWQFGQLAHIRNSAGGLNWTQKYLSAVYRLRDRFFFFIIGGNLFSACASNHPSVGASTAIVGIFAGYFVFLILNWEYLGRFGQYRCMLLVIVVILILMNLSFVDASKVDLFGHLGTI